MTIKKLSKEKHVRLIIAQYPDMKPAEIAKRANCAVNTVYTVKWLINKENNRVNKAFSPNKASVLKPWSPKVATPDIVKQPRAVSIKEACEVLQQAVSGVNGVDVMVWGDTVQITYEGTSYKSTADDAYKVLHAIKTLAEMAI